MLLVGTGRSEITPAPGTPQGGWGAQIHQRGIGADLPFYATALTISDGESEVVIVDVDAIGFDEVITARMIDAIGKVTGLPRSHIRLSCTHTHSGPNTFRLPMIREGRDMAEAYLEALPGQIAGAAWQSRQSLQPVRAAAARGSCAINANRRVALPDGRIGVGVNERGFVDRSVRVVTFYTESGGIAATLLHYACHPTTIAWQAKHFTPDYPGMARQVMEHETGAPCLFLQGAAGNLGPKVGFTGNLEVYRRWGRILGLEGARLALEIDRPPVRYQLDGFQESGAPIALYSAQTLPDSEDRLQVSFRMVPLPVRELPSPEDAEADAERLRARCNAVRESGTEAEIRLATALATQAGMRSDLAKRFHGRTTMEWPLQTFRFGPIALTCTAGEPFAETGADIADNSPFAYTLFSGYSNGGFGYLPTPQAFQEGGYETSTSPFADNVADVLKAATLEQLNDLNR